MEGSRIIEILSQLGIHSKSSGSARNIAISCPFREQHISGQDKTPSFLIKNNPYGPSPFFCWSCKKKGTLRRLLKILQNQGDLTQSQYDEFLTGEPILATRPNDKILKPRRNTKDVPIPAKITIGVVPRYILNRGISRESCKRWALGQHSQTGEAIFTVWNRKGVRKGFIARGVTDFDSKYRVLFGFNSTDFLYGEHKIPGWKGQRSAILVEGGIDTIISEQLGIYGVLGTMGTLLSPEHIETIKSHFDSVYLLGDRDEAGMKFQERAIKCLIGKVRLYEPQWFPKGKKDPKELSLDEYLTVLDRFKRV